MIWVSVGNHPVRFMLDTGAEVSVSKIPMGKVTNRKIPVCGATDKMEDCNLSPETIVSLGHKQLIHFFKVYQIILSPE